MSVFCPTCLSCDTESVQVGCPDGRMGCLVLHWGYRCRHCETPYRLPLSKKGRVLIFCTGIISFFLSAFVLYVAKEWISMGVNHYSEHGGTIYYSYRGLLILPLGVLFVVALPLACFYVAFAKD